MIEFRDVVKNIKGNNVINHVSFSISSGEIIGIKGINGSGKTMLLRLIAGLIIPTSGEILVNGKMIGKEINHPENIGVLIENPSFLGSYSGLENLQILASIRHRVTQETLIFLLKQVGLEQAIHLKYKKYSLGMKQRLGIAAAVMENPDIILLDEPTNALDLDGIKMVKNTIIAHHTRGATIIVASHDIDFLSEISTRVITIDHGQIEMGVNI